MTRRAYVTRLALGRSAFESLEQNQNETDRGQTQGLQEPAGVIGQDGPSTCDNVGGLDEELGLKEQSEEYVQLYDSRGHPYNPSSRAYSRELIRCGNDCLATVGYVVNIKGIERHLDAPAHAERQREKDLQRLDDTIGENTIGLLYTFTGVCTLTALCWAPWATRNYLQISSYMNEISFLSMLSIRKKHFGTLQLLFAGFPAWIASILMQEMATSMIAAVKRRLKPIMLGTKRDQVSRVRRIAFSAVEHLMSFGAFAALVYPIRAFSILQSIDLLPTKFGIWPMLPSIGSLIPFSRTSPIGFSLTRNSHESWFSTLDALMHAPALLFFLHSYLFDEIEQVTRRTTWFALPKPDEADEFSFEAAWRAGLDDISLPYLMGRQSLTSVFMWFDLQVITMHMKRRLAGPNLTNEEDDRAAAEDEEEPMIEAAAEEDQDLAEDLGNVDGEIVMDHRGNVLNAPASPPLSQRSRTPSPVMESIEANGPHVTFDRDEEILNMQMELIGHPGHLRATFTSSLPEIALEHVGNSSVEHRVTLLSSHFGRMVSRICSTTAGIWMTMPLQIVAVRQLANALIASQASADAATLSAFSARQVSSTALGLGVWHFLKKPSWQVLMSHKSFFIGMAQCLAWDVSVKVLFLEMVYYSSVFTGYHKFRWGDRNR